MEDGDFIWRNKPKEFTSIENGVFVPSLASHENEVLTPNMENGGIQKVTHNGNEENPNAEISLRRSQREKRHTLSSDYEVYLNECDYDIGLNEDSISYNQDKADEKSTHWLNAMKEELQSMKSNNVWELVELPDGAKTVGCKWVFKTKRNSKGNIERYKVRLVAKGYTQKEGIDYKETFSPVSKKDSFRIIVALVAHYDLEL